MTQDRAGGLTRIHPLPARTSGTSSASARRVLCALVFAMIGMTLTACESLSTRPTADSAVVGDAIANSTQPASANTALPGDSTITLPASTTPPSAANETNTAQTPLADGAEAGPQTPLPAKPEGLIERLANSFTLPTSHEAAFEDELKWFAAHPEYLNRVFERARPYLYYISQQLSTRGMPAELALLPVIESAYDPFAYSSGRASGLWQIIPGTARHLGVRQNWWFDGRRDLIDSTRAALDYLETLNKRFDGDWLLAIAGYNSGGGGVSRAIERAKRAGHPTDFWGIRAYLPRETRAYVPRLLAISAIVAHPEAYGVDLPNLPDSPQIAVVDTGGQIDMALAAKLAGLDIDEVYQLNPGVNRWATDPKGSHRLIVPIADAGAFRTAIASLGDRDRVSWTRYKIKPGDSLIALAKKFATTPDALREVNDLDGNTIRAGHHLMIPHATASLASYSSSSAARLSARQNVDRNGTRQEHVVAAGESLWSIAQRFGVGVKSLAKWNSMAPGDTLGVGRKLVVFTRNGDATPKLVSVSSQADDNRIRRVHYTVERGDSLARIADHFNISVADLLKWNDDVSKDRYLQPGDKLTLFVNVTEQST